MPNQSAVRTRRRWLPRFGLRTLLVALTVISFLLGAVRFWYRSQEGEYQQELTIAERIDRLGGRVQWKSLTPAIVDWFCEFDACKRIVFVSCGFTEPKAAAEVAKEVCKLPMVRLFSVFDHQLNEEFVSNLTKNDKSLELSVNMGLTSHRLRDDELFAFLKGRAGEIQRLLPPRIKVLWDGSYNGPP